MSEFLPHPFWSFSLEVYAADGVARACLDLQDRRGCDVNVLLFCAWVGASGRGTLGADRLKSVLAALKRWQDDTVKPLRELRRRLAHDGPPEGAPREASEALRRKVADAEMAAEHVEQLGLAAHAPIHGDRDRPVGSRLRAAVGNLAVYALCLGVTPDERDRRAVVDLLAGAFPTLAKHEIEKAVGVEPARVH